MSFLYLEARKGILRRYTLIALALFLCLNTVKNHRRLSRRRDTACCGQYKRDADRLQHHI